jgi:O-antigen/teichoic acid export membrane protein
VSGAGAPGGSGADEPIATGLSEKVGMPEFDPLAGTEGGHGERVARGALLQQGAQIIRLIGGLVVVTVLAHRLTFAALGTYTILLSMITYVAFVKSSVMNAAVVGVARAAGEGRRERLDVIVSTGLTIYLAIGVLSGAALCGVGLAVLPSLNIPHGLYHEAQIGVLGLALATMLSWPVQIFDDLLRGLQRFAAVSSLEMFAMVVYVAGALLLAFTGAPVWELVTWNAAIPLLMGLACLLALRALHVHVRVALGLVGRAELRRFGAFSGMLVVGGVAELAVYSIDRFALSAIRSPATVGRYEGPLGAQNMIRYLNGVLSAPVVPIATAFLAANDIDRVRELFLRGLRYCYAATVPLSVCMIVYGAPILRLWLGDRFGSMGTAASVFCAWWLVGSNSGMVSTMLIAAGHTKRLVAGSWLAAIVNVVLVFALTGALGIYGPIIASLAAFGATMAYTLPVAMRTADVSWSAAARRAWLPSMSIGAVLACLLLALRWGAHLTSKPATAGIVVAALLLYWALYAIVWLSAEERHLALYALRLRGSRR